MKKVNLSGMRFGYLTVISDSGNRTKNGTVIWKCLCDCGNKTDVAANNLKSKNHPTISCGCKRKKNFLKNGYCALNRRLYNIFQQMKQRCYNPKHPKFSNYGGRGISICNEWLSDYMEFYRWSIENGYQEGFSIDRINNNIGYSPDNCRWVPAEKQSGNRSNCVNITFNKETHCIAEWAKITGIKDGTIRARIKKGWPIDKVFKK